MQHQEWRQKWRQEKEQMETEFLKDDLMCAIESLQTNPQMLRSKGTQWIPVRAETLKTMNLDELREKFRELRLIQEETQYEPEPAVPVVRMPDGTEVPASQYARTENEKQIEEKILKRLQQDIEHVLKEPTFGRNWYLKQQHLIRFGRDRIGRADITLLINSKPFMIVECKRPRVSPTEISEGKEQLESYLNASRANLGIFATNDDPSNWTYYDNSIGFDKISLSTFWGKIGAAFNTERDIEKRAQQLKLQRIEKRAKQLVAQAQENMYAQFVAQAREDICARANKIIDEEAKKRVTQNAIQGAVARLLQQEKKQLQVQLQNKIDQFKSKINNLQIALEESKNRATWGWTLFGISVVIILIIAANS